MTSGYQAGVPPRKVLLFSGHMIDTPGRREARFPANKEPIAANAIAEMLIRIDAGPADLAICGGACGGDLLFAEASIRRGSRLELYIPFDESTFLAKSVDFADANWHSRFLAAKSQATHIGWIRRNSGPGPHHAKTAVLHDHALRPDAARRAGTRAGTIAAVPSRPFRRGRDLSSVAMAGGGGGGLTVKIRSCQGQMLASSVASAERYS